MNMTTDPLASWLVPRADSSGIEESLIGDVLEEMALGRSRWWICGQLLGVCWFTLESSVRRRATLTPPVVTCALCATLLTALSVLPVNRVVLLWLAFYFVSGTLSLFAHMSARSADLRGTVPREGE
jgi:hypothetical protein